MTKLTKRYCPNGHRTDIAPDYLPRYPKGAYIMHWCRQCYEHYFDRDCLTEEQLAMFGKYKYDSNSVEIEGIKITSQGNDDPLDWKWNDGIIAECDELKKENESWINFSDREPETGELIDGIKLLTNGKSSFLDKNHVTGRFKYMDGNYGVIEIEPRYKGYEGVYYYEEIKPGCNAEVKGFYKWRPAQNPNRDDSAQVEEKYIHWCFTCKGSLNGLGACMGCEKYPSECTCSSIKSETVRENRTDECDLPNSETNKSQSQVAIEKVIEAISHTHIPTSPGCMAHDRWREHLIEKLKELNQDAS